MLGGGGVQSPRMTPPPWRRTASGALLATLWAYALVVSLTSVVPTWHNSRVRHARGAALLVLGAMVAWCFVQTVRTTSFYRHTAPLPPCRSVKTSNGQARWCSKCQAPKPDRCHHCRQCGRCILKMDHHCPWLMDTCIGLRNYKAFFLFLMYACAFCILIVDTIVRAVLQGLHDHGYTFDLPIAWVVLLALAFLVRTGTDPSLRSRSRHFSCSTSTWFSSTRPRSSRSRGCRRCAAARRPRRRPRRACSASCSVETGVNAQPRSRSAISTAWTGARTWSKPWAVMSGCGGRRSGPGTWPTTHPSASDGLVYPINEETWMALQHDARGYNAVGASSEVGPIA